MTNLEKWTYRAKLLVDLKKMKLIKYLSLIEQEYILQSLTELDYLINPDGNTYK